MTRTRKLYELIAAVALTGLAVAPAWAVVTVPPPPTNQGGGSPPGGGNPGSPPVTNNTPEPATLLTAAIGSAAVGFMAWRRRRQAD